MAGMSVNYFDAPADTVLDPDTEYYLNFHSAGDSADDLNLGSVTSDDQTGEPDWAIEDAYRHTSSSGGSSLRIDVTGHPRLSDDASLSGLALEESGGDSITLTPDFDTNTTS